VASTVSDTPAEYRDLDDMLQASQVDVVRGGPVDPAAVARRRRRRLRGLLAAAIVFAVVAASAGVYLSSTLLAPVPETAGTLRSVSVEPGAAVVFRQPAALATAVSVTGAEEFPGTVGEGGILNATGGNEPRPIASISKVITALVVLGAKPLGESEAGPTLTFSKADNDLYDKYYLLGATIEHMKIGSTMSERDALGMMLLASASNYAEAVSTWAFGSPAATRRATDAWLAANGLAGTKIVEPTGIDPRNTSTPTDLIAIARLAMANPAVALLVRTPQLDIPAVGVIHNRNPVLGADGINGIKTGTLDEAGSCLLYSAVIDVPGLDNPVTIVGIVLGASDSFTAGTVASDTIATIRDGFHLVQVAASGEEVGDFVTDWDDTARVVVSHSLSMLTWANMPVTHTESIDPVVTAPGGTEIGSMTFTAGTRTATVPLRLSGSIDGPGGWWRIGHPGELL
jgi:D-alanyl-D-alanine carboxypeptidase (penicillin-binding protein 5/6)